MRSPHKSVLAALVLTAAALPTASMADMFIWKDPETGRTRMSNIPPLWLRDGSIGPRVEVLRGNRPIDASAAFANPQPPAELSARQRAAAGLPDKDKPVAPLEPPKAATLADEDEE